MPSNLNHPPGLHLHRPPHRLGRCRCHDIWERNCPDLSLNRCIELAVRRELLFQRKKGFFGALSPPTFSPLKTHPSKPPPNFASLVPATFASAFHPEGRVKYHHTPRTLLSRMFLSTGVPDSNDRTNLNWLWQRNHLHVSQDLFAPTCEPARWDTMPLVFYGL